MCKSVATPVRTSLACTYTHTHTHTERERERERKIERERINVCNHPRMFRSDLLELRSNKRFGP